MTSWNQYVFESSKLKPWTFHVETVTQHAHVSSIRPHAVYQVRYLVPGTVGYHRNPNEGQPKQASFSCMSSSATQPVLAPHHHIYFLIKTHHVVFTIISNSPFVVFNFPIRRSHTGFPATWRNWLCRASVLLCGRQFRAYDLENNTCKKGVTFC
jgi:hypothetical protein